MSTQSSISVTNVGINFSRENYLEDPSVSEVFLDSGQERIRLLGKDLFMFATGDLLLEERIREFEKVDLGRAAGIYDYAQSITHRLMTARGTLPEDRFFGVPWYNYIGRSYVSSTAVRSNLIQDITDELYRDNRTREVVYVKAEFESPTVIRVDCAVVPIGTINEQIEVTLSVGEV